MIERLPTLQYFLREYSPHSYVMLACYVGIPAMFFIHFVEIGVEPAALVAWGTVVAMWAFFGGAAWVSMYEDVHGETGESE
jgi:hypothetical protein